MDQKPKRVLIIDDQPDERTIQAMMLGHIGYGVSEAADGAAGIALAMSDPPDLVLLDVAMPRLDGFTVCRTLRDDSRTTDVRILIFTASVAGDLHGRAEAAGADAVLMKPLDPRSVAAEVERLIGPPIG
jgi:CheY-like chemotaxis protein